MKVPTLYVEELYRMHMHMYVRCSIVNLNHTVYSTLYESYYYSSTVVNTHCVKCVCRSIVVLFSQYTLCIVQCVCVIVL